MRIEYINPFVDSAIEVLKKTVTNEITRGELSLRNSVTPMMGLALLVGLAGQVTGRVVIDMPQHLGLQIASIMNEENFKDFNDLTNATLTELANMIVGKAVTTLHHLGYKFDLTPPALFMGDNLRLADDKIEALIVPLELLSNKLEINVALKEV
jgi:chemotaxis protein CheX